MMYPNQNMYLPKWITNKALTAYFVALLAIIGLYSSYMLPWYYMLAGVVSVTAFFYGGAQLSREWSIERVRTTKSFEKKVFRIALLPRLGWTILIYFIFLETYGDPFGFIGMDEGAYNWQGQTVAKLLSKGNLHLIDGLRRYDPALDFSDMGYGIYLGFIYFLFGESILLVRIIKCFISSYTCVLVYRLAKRNFGEFVGRLSAIFCILWPGFWFYCGTLLKEIEMIFLCVLFINQADVMLRDRKFTLWRIVPVLLLALTLFSFRTPLALVAVLSLLFTIVMSSTKVVSWGKRLMVGVLAIGLIGVTMGNRVQEETSGLLETVRSDQQKSNMEWRAVRKDAAGYQNKFAKYAGAAVFAPLIFTIPFPTMVSPYEGQQTQKILHGANFIKNLLSGFLIFAMFALLFSGRWREYLLPLSFLLGYLVVLTFSNFAQSGRFHMPVMPLEMIFAALGAQLVMSGESFFKRGGKKVGTYKKWYLYWVIACVIFAIGWNWFKLAGRGII